MASGAVPKDPVEQFPISLDWTRKLPPGRTLTRVTGSAVDLADNSAAAILVSTAGVLSGMIGSLTVKAGVLGKRYRVMFDAYDNATGHYRGSIVIVMRSA